MARHIGSAILLSEHLETGSLEAGGFQILDQSGLYYPMENNVLN